MKFNIAQIGKNRLKRVLIDDRDQSPQKLCEVLKSDLFNVAKCYMEEPSLDIESYEENEDVIFVVKISTKRIKSMAILDA